MRKRHKKKDSSSTFKIGDSVVVKPGIKDVEFGSDMGGWQGRITEISKDSKPVVITIQWDSITLKNISKKIIEQCEETGMSWDESTSTLKISNQPLPETPKMTSKKFSMKL